MRLQSSVFERSCQGRFESVGSMDSIGSMEGVGTMWRSTVRREADEGILQLWDAMVYMVSVHSVEDLRSVLTSTAGLREESRFEHEHGGRFQTFADVMQEQGGLLSQDEVLQKCEKMVPVSPDNRVRLGDFPKPQETGKHAEMLETAELAFLFGKFCGKHLEVGHAVPKSVQAAVLILSGRARF